MGAGGSVGGGVMPPPGGGTVPPSTHGAPGFGGSLTSLIEKNWSWRSRPAWPAATRASTCPLGETARSTGSTALAMAALDFTEVVSPMLNEETADSTMPVQVLPSP